MELKRYQRRVLDNLRSYARRYAACGDAGRAYDELLAEDGLAPGHDGVERYRDELGGAPKVCVKVPTGGGKTFIAANALAPIFDELPDAPCDVVVWLVPRKEILRQTYRQLADPANPLRMAIDRDFAHCVEVLDKEDGLVGRGFTRSTVEDQLTIFVLSYDSFKNKDGRRAFAENSALAPLTSYQRSTGQAAAVEGADDTALISALAGTNPVVVVDESHHAGSRLSLDMLRNLNPRFVLELTATPRGGANVISRVKAAELKAEEMVKLPVVVYRRQDKLDVLQDAILLQHRLEQAAKAVEESGGYVRPIVLLQAERHGADDAETYARLKAKLVEAGIPTEQVAVRTGDVDELGDIDLMSRACPIRYVITVEALAEGWDCPFAYVLATVANKSSKVSVEQLVGRVLRQPYARRSPVRALNISYVLTSSADFTDTVDQVVAGLNGAGFSRADVVTGETGATGLQGAAGTTETQAVWPQVSTVGAGAANGPFATADADATASNAPALLGTNLHAPFGTNAGAHNAGTSNMPALLSQGKADGVDWMLRDAEAIEGGFEQRAAQEQAAAPGTSTGLGDRSGEFRIRDAIAASVEGLRIPQFRRRVDAGLFSTGETVPFEYQSLLADFNLAKCGTGEIEFDPSAFDGAREVDVSEESGDVKIRQLDGRKAGELRRLFERYTPEGKRRAVAEGIVSIMPAQFVGTYGMSGLRDYTRRAVDLMDEAQVDAYADNAGAYARTIMGAVRALALDWRRDRFAKRLDAGSVFLAPSYEFPPALVRRDPVTTYERTLYMAEDGGMNGIERKMADALANCDRVLWWHRVAERRPGEFFINGFINHYPDFLAMTRGGTVLAVETKGEQLKNDDSRDKLALGRTWADGAGAADGRGTGGGAAAGGAGTDGGGRRYRYFMVFDHDAIDAASSYTLAEFKQILAEME